MPRPLQCEVLAGQRRQRGPICRTETLQKVSVDDNAMQPLSQSLRKSGDSKIMTALACSEKKKMHGNNRLLCICVCVCGCRDKTTNQHITWSSHSNFWRMQITQQGMEDSCLRESSSVYVCICVCGCMCKFSIDAFTRATRLCSSTSPMDEMILADPSTHEQVKNHNSLSPFFHAYVIAASHTRRHVKLI